MSGFNVPPNAIFLSNSGNNNGGTALGFNLTVGGTPTNRVCYLTGLNYTATGATAATIVTITIATNSQSYVFQYPVGAAAGVLQTPLILYFDPPISNQGVGLIGVTASAPGAGATQAVLNIWGYML